MKREAPGKVKRENGKGERLGFAAPATCRGDTMLHQHRAVLCEGSPVAVAMVRERSSA